MSQCTYHQDERELLRFIEQLPEYFPLIWNLAKIFQDSYNYQKAATYYIKAWQLDAKSVKAVDVALCLMKSKKYNQAIEFYLQVPEEEANEQLYNEIAYCYREIADYLPCIKYYEKALSYDSESTWFLGNIGWCYQQVKQFYKGLTFHLRSHKINSKDTWNIDNIGYCYQRLKQPQKAIEYYELSLTYQPKQSWPLRQAGWCGFITGRLEWAKQLFEEAYQNPDKDETSEYTLMNMAHVYWCLEDTQKAKRFYRKSVLKFKTEEEFKKDMNDDYQYIKQYSNITFEMYEGMKNELLAFRHKSSSVKS